MLDDDDRLIYLASGPMAALALGVVLVPLREVTSASNLTFVFLAWTIVVGHLGGRWSAVATALTSALSLDFFLTKPYMRLSIDSKHDLIAFLGLGLCGLVAAALGARREPPAASRQQIAVLDEALRQLEQGGPADQRLRLILDRLLRAFPLAAVVVRDGSGRVLASSGSAELCERAPAADVRIDDLASDAERSPGKWDHLPEAGLRVCLFAGRQTIGSLDLWAAASRQGTEGLRLIPPVARVVAALLALSDPPAHDRHVAEPVESLWTRPGRGSGG